MLHQHVFDMQTVPAFFLAVVFKCQVFHVKELPLRLVCIDSSHLLTSVCPLCP
jgi:hypothetical protein